MLLAERAHDLVDSDRQADELSRLLGGGLLDASAPTAVAFAAAARSELRQGNWDNARSMLNQALKLTPFLTDAIPWLAVQARLELARTFVAIRDISLARSLLAEIDRIFDRRPDLGVLAEQTGELRADARHDPMLDDGKGSNLTTAEMRLMPYLTTHLSFREIGDRLHLSRNTIKTQAISIYRKLGVTTRGDAIDEASAARSRCRDGAGEGDRRPVIRRRYGVQRGGRRRRRLRFRRPGLKSVSRASPSSRMMCTAAEVSGAARTSPIIPTRQPGADRDDEHHERVQIESRSHRKRLQDVLEQSVRQQHDDEHDQGGGRSLWRRARSGRRRLLPRRHR